MSKLQLTGPDGLHYVRADSVHVITSVKDSAWKPAASVLKDSGTPPSPITQRGEECGWRYISVYGQLIRIWDDPANMTQLLERQ